MTKPKPKPTAKPHPKPKALPAGKRPKASRRRQSTKKATPAEEKSPPAEPVVDPRIVALREIADWILRGENEVSIAEAIRTRFPKEDANSLLASAFEYLGELAGTDPDLRRTWHIAARRELYRRTVEIHDFKTARDILRDLGQLEGLYPKMSPTKSKTSKPSGDQVDDQVDDGIPTSDGIPLLQ